MLEFAHHFENSFRKGAWETESHLGNRKLGQLQQDMTIIKNGWTMEDMIWFYKIRFSVTLRFFRQISKANYTM